RMELPVDAFIPSYGWGTRYAQISVDDSQVKDVEGNFGQAGKYTYRTWNTLSFAQLNYWTYDTSTDADYQALINGSFYTQALNDARTGWEFVPELAASAPVPFGPTVTTVNGKTSSKTWRITLKDDLEWAFNANINTTGFDLDITAEDFY